MRLTRMLRHLENESGLAALLMVVFSILILAAVGLSFFADTQQKQQGAAIGYTADEALPMAESGLRYAEKCLEFSDPNCPCNTGAPNDCTDFLNLVPFSVPFGDGRGRFDISFANATLDNCNVDVTSKGVFHEAIREVSSSVKNQGGGFTAIDNPQGTLVSVNPAIGTQNPLSVAQSNKSATITLSYTVPVGFGNDLVLVVVAGATANAGTDTEPSSATFGGNPMTKVGGIFTDGSQKDPGVGMFYLAVTPNQTGTIQVTFPGNTDNRTLHAVTLTNTANVAPAPVRTIANLNGNTTDNITTSTDGAMIVTGAYHRDNVTMTALGANHAILSTVASSQSAGAMGRVTTTTAGPYSGIGFTATTVTRMVQILAAFKPAHNSISMSYTVNSGLSADIQLVVVGGAEATPGSNANPVSASFAGSPMTLVSKLNAPTSGNGIGLGMFRLAVAPGASGTITVLFSSATSNRTLHAISIDGAKDATPIVQTATNTSGSIASITQNITTVGQNSMVITAGYQDVATALVAIADPPAVHTLRDSRVPSSSAGALGSLPAVTPGTRTNVGWTTNSAGAALLILASFKAQSPC